MLEKAPVLFGLGIVENAYNGVAKIEAIPKQSIFEREKELLSHSKQIMGKMLVPEYRRAHHRCARQGYQRRGHGL